MEREHDVTYMSGREVGEIFNKLVDDGEDGEAKLHKFFAYARNGKYEIFQIKYDVEADRVLVKFADDKRPTWKKVRSCLRELSGNFNAFLKTELGSYRKAAFKTNHFKIFVLLLREIAQSGINATSPKSRLNTEHAIRAALSKNSCNADFDDLIVFLASSRERNSKSYQNTRRKIFERLMIRKTSRQMRAVLRQGYFTVNSKQRLRETVSLYKETPNVYLRDAVKTLSKILYQDEFFDLRNKEAFKIILTVFGSITVFDSINE